MFVPGRPRVTVRLQALQNVSRRTLAAHAGEGADRRVEPPSGLLERDPGALELLERRRAPLRVSSKPDRFVPDELLRGVAHHRRLLLAEVLHAAVVPVRPVPVPARADNHPAPAGSAYQHAQTGEQLLALADPSLR